MSAALAGPDLRIHTVRGLFWSGVQRTGAQALALVAFVVLSRLLAPEDFGLLALANAFLLVALHFIEQGPNQVIVQRQEVSPRHLDAAFSLSIGLAGLLAILLLILAGPLARLFDEPRLEPIVRWLAPVLLLAGLRSTQSAILQREMRFRELAARSTLAEAIGGGVGIGMAFAGLGVWSLVGQAIARGGAGVVVLWRVSKWRPRLQLSLQPTRDIVRFGTPVVLDRLVSLVQGKADDVLIGLAQGATALGYYSVGYRLLTYLLPLLSGTVQAVALPVLSRLVGEPDRLRRVFLTSLEFLTLAAFPVFVGVAWVAPELVPLAFGPRWQPSIPVMQVLALAGAVKILPLATSTLLTATGRPGFQLRLNTVTTAAAVLGFALAAPWGILAVAVVHLAINLLAVPLHAAALARLVSIPVGSYLRSMATAATGVLAMSALLLILSRFVPTMAPLLWMGIQIAGGAATYLGATAMIGKSAYLQARRLLRDGLVAWPEATPPEGPLANV